jgi:protoporphyrinogen oxidase
MWARLYKRTASLGYFAGGFQAFVDLLAERVRAQDGAIRFNTPVQAVRASQPGQLRLESASGSALHERVIATCSPRQMLELAPDLPEEYAGQLRALRSMGAVVLILALKQQLTQGHYWINMPKSEGIPFMGLVEHTNYISPEHYGGDHVIYCGDYLEPDHPYFSYTKEQLLKTYLPGLVRINPAFSPDWIRASWTFSEPYAQPIPGLNHSQHIPALRTPLAGLWLASMSQVYPWDRGTNYAVELGRTVAAEVAA